MTMTDTGGLGVAVTSGDGRGVAPLITAIEDPIVPETVDLLEDLVVAEAIRTMIGKTLFTPFELQTRSLYSFNYRFKKKFLLQKR